MRLRPYHIEYVEMAAFAKRRRYVVPIPFFGWFFFACLWRGKPITKK